MIAYVVKRLLWMIPVLLGVSFFVLILISLAPGDPARMVLGPLASEEEVYELQEALGLHDPLLVRYVHFVEKAVQGDLGTSTMTSVSITKEIGQRFPYTLQIVAISMVIAVLIGIPLGVYAAIHQYSWKDNAAIFASLFCVSMPNFWFALILVQIFCVKLGWLPATGVDSWQSWILPCVSLAIGYAAIIARQARSSMLEVIRQDYIVTARAKGQSERIVIYVHALRNALIPIIMVIGTTFGLSLGGAIISESIFSIPGIGNYVLTALVRRDYPAIQGSVLFLAIVFSLVMLAVDLIFAFVDPRIRSQYGDNKNKKKRRTSLANI